MLAQGTARDRSHVAKHSLGSSAGSQSLLCPALLFRWSSEMPAKVTKQGSALQKYLLTAARTDHCMMACRCICASNG